MGGSTQTPQPLEPPYCQVVGCNAVVLLTREQIEWIASDCGAYSPNAEVAHAIGAEMRRALIALDAARPE